MFSPLALGAQQPVAVSLLNFFCRQRTLCSACSFCTDVLGRPHDPGAHSHSFPVCVLDSEFVELIVRFHGQGEHFLCGLRLLVGFLTGWGVQAFWPFFRVTKPLLFLPPELDLFRFQSITAVKMSRIILSWYVQLNNLNTLSSLPLSVSHKLFVFCST